MAVDPIPAQYGSVTPYLVVDGASRLIDFAKQAFGAQEIARMPGPGGTIGHAEIRFGDRVVMLADGGPENPARTAALVLYVNDCVEGLVLAAERYDGPEPVNLGAGKEISIRELAELIGEVTGFAGRIVWDATKPGGQPRRSVDATRAQELLGFEARIPLREGIERTVAWYRSAVAGVGH
jgi:nucleoside-diphosphate-sugar epimerase